MICEFENEAASELHLSTAKTNSTYEKLVNFKYNHASY